MSIDWGTGYYELTAERLLPAARELMEMAAPQPGERVVDVGCGTGNAAVLAAGRGAVVIGVDPAERLLDVARRRATDAGADIDFRVGEAAALPVPDASADLVVSVFAAIFAPDPAAALASMANALAPGGRIVMSAWVPGNAVSRMNQIVRSAAGGLVDTPAPSPPGGLAWHEPEQVRSLAAGHGLELTATERSIAFTDRSPEAYLAGEEEHHPVAITTRRLLEQHGRWEEIRSQALAELVAGNEDPSAFRVTSRYVILTLRRS